MRVLSSASHPPPIANRHGEPVSLVWKVVVGLVVALMLPVAAYAVSTVSAPPEGPVPRPDIRITDAPASAPPSSAPPAPGQTSAGDKAPRREDRKKPKRDSGTGDDDVRVVTPRPAPVGEDDDDDGGGDDDGDNDGDDSDDGSSGGDDD